MRQIIHLWLEPTLAQTIALQQTQEVVNAARNEISAVAWYTGTFTIRALYDLCAEDIGTREGLSLAMTHRCVANVAAAYRVQRRAQQRYHPLQSIPYDRHTLRIDAQDQLVTIWTVIGWQRIAFTTEAVVLDGWSHPSLMQLHGAWALLLVLPDLDNEGL